MAPGRIIKTTKNGISLDQLTQNSISTRSKKVTNMIELNQNATRNKRKAEGSPTIERKKRSALGNLTNANVLKTSQFLKEKSANIIVQKPVSKNGRAIPAIKEENENFPKPLGPTARVPVHNKVQTRASSRAHPALNQAAAAPIATNKVKEGLDLPKTTRRLSNDFEKSETSLYMSALEDLTNNDQLEFHTIVEEKPEDISMQTEEKLDILPRGIEDFDKENWKDPYQVSEYVMDIFKYLKNREKHFVIKDYMPKQPYLSKWMRSLLVDWMVEVQESFELNHETLYLAVKLVDIYLGKEIVKKDFLQLLGAAALLISCKFDERTPPLVDDFLYICDGAYQQPALLKMEQQLFRTVDYDLGIPLSYRFLRRYARCAKVTMPVLTLARFILEYSLMDYATIQLSDSKLASAALFIALRMNKMKGWNQTLEYYSGYKLEEFAQIAIVLNNGIHKKPKDTLNTIRNKYSHTIFHEVAKIPLITNAHLFSEDG